MRQMEIRFKARGVWIVDRFGIGIENGIRGEHGRIDNRIRIAGRPYLDAESVALKTPARPFGRADETEKRLAAFPNLLLVP